MSLKKKLVSAVIVLTTLSVVGVAGAAINRVIISGAGGNAAVLKCPGGMTLMGHEVNENMSIFQYDPSVHIFDLYTADGDGFLVEDVEFGAHAGTHLDVPSHFGYDGSIDDLGATEFVWPVYKLDVRGVEFDEGYITKNFIEQYELRNGKIPQGSMVVLQTGAEEFFGLNGANDKRAFLDEEEEIAFNEDDMFTFENAGVSEEVVDWLFKNRKIVGMGSDAYGPDSSFDTNFTGTNGVLKNGGVALVALANVSSLNVRGDIILAPTVRLSEGSGFSTNPIACHGKAKRR